MNLTISLTVEQYLADRPAPDPASLFHALQQVPDGRKARGKRYPLALILTLLLLGKLAGETTIHGVVDWVYLRERWLRQQLGWPRRFPSNATYTRALAACDAEELAKMIAAVFIKASSQEAAGNSQPSERQRHVAIDGKSMRGTRKHHVAHQPAVHVVACYEPQSGLVLAHRAMADKENEISTLARWLSPTLVKDRIISTDALHTYRAFCADVIRFGGQYLLIAKKNQPTLWQDLHDFFTDPQGEEHECQQAQTWNKGHGRLEERRIRTTTLLNPLWDREWTGVGQAFEMRRRVTHPYKCTQQIVYGITSLTPSQADPERLLQLLREHWHIENRLHWRRDVTLGEDASQVRTCGAPLALAALNGAVLSLMDWLHISNVAAGMRRFSAYPQEAVSLLMGPFHR